MFRLLFIRLKEQRPISSSPALTNHSSGICSRGNSDQTSCNRAAKGRKEKEGGRGEREREREREKWKIVIN